MKKVSILIIGLLLSFAACGDDSSDNGISGVIVTNDSVEASGAQVYNEDDGKPITDSSIDGDYSEELKQYGVTDLVCEVKNGKLTINLGVPSITDSLKDDWGLPVSDASIGGVWAYFYKHGPDWCDLYFAQAPTDAANLVHFVYVTKDVMINYEDSSVKWQNVSLKAGWNTVLSCEDESTQKYVYKNGKPDSSYKWWAYYN